MADESVTTAMEQKAQSFYKEFLDIIYKSKIPFLVSGTYAVKFYTSINRPTKDIDVFCKAGDYLKILKIFQEKGFKVKILDDRWLAKVYKNRQYADIIFGSIPGLWPINDYWFKRAQIGTILGHKVKVTPPEELILSKLYRQGRTQYEGADVAHLILKQGAKLDWKHLLNRVEPHWEVLLGQLINFRFVYPSERGIVPNWLMKELLHRVELQLEMPSPLEKVCKGSMLSHRQYQIAYTDWDYKDLTDFFYKENPFDQDAIK
ncbi:MAG: hypothetical protein QG639_175 [Patescibacteria group bacterium]|nr:hypothetical protein [Patescibacteria group bacterium]